MFDILEVQTAKIYFWKRRKTEERTLPILITPFPASGSRDASKPLPGLWLAVWSFSHKLLSLNIDIYNLYVFEI